MSTPAADFSFKQIITNKKLFIKPYQRPYAWEERQWNDLWEDLLHMYNSKEQYEKRRFIGTIILKEVDREEINTLGLRSMKDGNDTISFYDIVDGQQRFTTILLCLSVVAHQLKGRNDKVGKKITKIFSLSLLHETKKYPFLTTSRSDVTKYLFNLLTEGLNKESDVELDLAGSSDRCVDLVKDIFPTEDPTVLEIRQQQSNALALASTKRLEEAYKFFAKKFKAFQDNTEYTEILLAFDTLLREGLRFTCYHQDERLSVSRTFSGLNDRGKSLTDLENTKTLFMSFAGKMTDLNLVKEIDDTWNFLLEELANAGLTSNSDELDFLKCAWRLFYVGSAPTKDVYSQIKDTFAKAEKRRLKGVERNLRSRVVHVDDDSDEAEDDISEQPPQKKRRIEEEETEKIDLRSHISNFLDLARKTVPMYCFLKGSIKYPKLLFSDKFEKKALFTLQCMLTVGSEDSYIPLVMAAHYSLIIVEGYRWRSDAYSEEMVDFLHLLKIHQYRLGWYSNKRFAYLYDIARLLQMGRTYDAKNEINFVIIYNSLILDIERSANDKRIKSFFNKNPKLYMAKCRGRKSEATMKRRKLLNLTLLEYELSLRRASPTVDALLKLKKDTTIEHIYPQDHRTQYKNFGVEDETQQDTYCHSLGNMVLTSNGTKLGSKSFKTKCAIFENGLQSEQQIADGFDEWTFESVNKRRDKLSEFIIEHYRIPASRGLKDASRDVDGLFVLECLGL